MVMGWGGCFVALSTFLRTTRTTVRMMTERHLRCPLIACEDDAAGFPLVYKLRQVSHDARDYSVLLIFPSW